MLHMKKANKHYRWKIVPRKNIIFLFTPGYFICNDRTIRAFTLHQNQKYKTAEYIFDVFLYICYIFALCSLIKFVWTMECVAHYSDSCRTFSNLKPLSSNQHQRLMEAKYLREKETSQQNRHLIQCRSIPSKDGLDVTSHGIHLEPC